MIPDASAELRAWLALRRVDAVLMDALDTALRRDAGVTLAEHDVLRQIEKSGGTIQMGDAARILVLSKSGATRLVGKLEGDGLVERIVFPQNRRATFARLTDAGRARLEVCDETFEQVLGETFTTYLSESDLRHLQRVLGKVLDGNGWCGQTVCAEFAREDVPSACE